MARDGFIDVTVEVPYHELPSNDEEAAKTIIGLLRHKADEVCAESGARLRTDRLPEVIVKRGAHVLVGGDYVLAASRWAVVMPEKVAREVF